MKFTEIWSKNDHETNAVLALCTDNNKEFEIIIIPTSRKNQVLIIYDDGKIVIINFNDVDFYFDIKDYAYLNANIPKKEFGTVIWGKI